MHVDVCSGQVDVCSGLVSVQFRCGFSFGLSSVQVQYQV
jgi:hypothetical protein